MITIILVTSRNGKTYNPTTSTTILQTPKTTNETQQSKTTQTYSNYRKHGRKKSCRPLTVLEGVGRSLARVGLV